MIEQINWSKIAKKLGIDLIAPEPKTPEIIEEVTFAASPLEIEESKEVPYKYLVVVADDEEKYAHAVKSAAENALNSKESSDHNGVVVVTSAEELLNVVLTGNNGRSADVVLLDDAYILNNGQWNLRLSLVEKVALQQGIDYSPFTDKVVNERGFSQRAMDVYLGRPGSINFALTLRTLGYPGKIFVISSAPPDPDQFMRGVAHIRENIPSFPDQMPIDGVSRKRFMPGIGMQYANSIRQNLWSKYGDWDYKTDQEDLTGALAQLIK